MENIDFITGILIELVSKKLINEEQMNRVLELYSENQPTSAEYIEVA